MNKFLYILFVILIFFSCKNKQNYQESSKVEVNNDEKSKNTDGLLLNENDLDKTSKDGLEIWKLIVNQEFSKLSEYIDEKAGLMISTEAIFYTPLDFIISKEEVAKIDEDDTIHDLYFSAPGIFFPYTNKKVFDQFFSFQLSRVSEIKTNAIVERDYIYEDYSIPILLAPFPKDSALVDVFIEPVLEGSSDWYHIFLVIRYIDDKAFLYGLGIAYMDF